METVIEQEKIVARKIGLKYMHIRNHSLMSSQLLMTNNAIEKLASILVRREVEKNKLLLREGEILDRMYYVEKGMLRQFYYKHGRDLTENFISEDNMCVHVEGHLKKKSNNLLIESLEPGVLYEIPYFALLELMKNDREISSMYRTILECALIQSYRRIDALRLESASDRYRRLLHESPEIVMRVPLFHIASYLFMSQETLSRVRSRGDL
jgi:CRP-like cAMP-binding protein